MNIAEDSESSLSWSQRLLEVLCGYQESGLHCDTVLESTDGDSFLVHGCVMAAASPTFHQELLTQGYVKTPVSGPVLKAAIGVAYTGSAVPLADCNLVDFCAANESYFKLCIPGLVFAQDVNDTECFEGDQLSKDLQDLLPENIKDDVVFNLENTVESEMALGSNPEAVNSEFLEQEGNVENKCVTPINVENLQESPDANIEPITIFVESKRPLREDLKKVSKEQHAKSAVKTRGKLYLCDVCSKEFKRKADLTIHLRMHTGEKPYGCAYCEKSFARVGHKNAHERIHTGERPYKCDVCEKAFKESSHLKEHERIHTGARDFQCQYCPKSYTSSNNLVLHEKTHRGEKNYQCAYCENRFIRRGDLTVHERYHTGERPYPCDRCEKAFFTITARIAHQKRHADCKDHKCGVCGKGFATSSNLRSHQRVHSTVKPHWCPHCNKTFKHLHQKRRHELTHK